MQDSFEFAISPAHNLSGLYANEYYSKYTNDGNQIVALQATINTNYALCLYDSNLAESSKSFIYETTNAINVFCISPDNTIIYFTMKVSGKFQIFKININGTNLVQLTAEPNNCINPVISPDGTTIAFSIDNGASNKYQIHTMNEDGTNIINISNNSYNDYCYDWK